jgi:hypothetical protein
MSLDKLKKSYDKLENQYKKLLDLGFLIYRNQSLKMDAIKSSLFIIYYCLFLK